MNAAASQWTRIQYNETQLGSGTTQQGQPYPGGLDLVTPSLRLQPGAVTDALNFEVAPFGGYTRIEGYERMDGRASPSAATYQVLVIVSGGGGTGFASTPTIGQTVTQDTSGATGVIIAINPSNPSYLILTHTTGVFDIGHAITIPGPTTVGVVSALTTPLTAETTAIYTAAAADSYRALIQQVPGSGGILGVVAMAFSGIDHVYAFRVNVGGSAVAIYKASGSGWTLVPFYKIVSFTAGTGTAADGDVLTQGGVTATIKRVMWQSGAWAGTAVGQFVITTPAGGNFGVGAATTTSGATITLSGIQAAITLLPGGKFEFQKANFSGQFVTRRIYGCDGINQCFEFDGDTLAPIKTGLAPDAPSHIRFHKNYLVISQGSSIFGCAAGSPFKWSAVDGAWEIATGDVVMGMITLPGSQTNATLGVFMQTNSAFLYGSDPTTFNYVAFNTGIGAANHSVQNLFDTFFLDDLGVVTLKTTLNWGNFLPSTLTRNILPFIARERGNLLASSVNRAKSQYRLFFSDGYALFCTVLNQQYLGSMPVLFPQAMSCVDTTNLTTGSEATYAGSSSNGYVFQMDTGTSFDGAEIPAYIVMAWDPIRSPRVLKRFRAASIEVQGGSFAAFQYGYQLGYNIAQVEQLPAVPVALNLSSPSYWDSFIWDSFIWDGNVVSPSDIDETGTAENIRVTITSGTNYISSYTVASVIHHYSLRRGLRV